MAGPANGDHSSPDDGGKVYLVPFRWWREAQELGTEEGARGIPYVVSQAPAPAYGGPMKLISNIFSSDLVFNLRRAGDLAEGENEERSYALVGEDLWAEAHRRRCSDSDMTVESSGNSSFAQDGTVDVYPLMLRFSVMRETSMMTIRISKRDNTVENYKRGSKLFSFDSEMVHIWDFSGQTNLILMNEWNRFPQECQGQSDQEILLELQVYALSDSMNGKNEGKKDNLAAQQSKMTCFLNGCSLASNGSTETMDSDFCSSRGSKGTESLGLTGLENLGNTCFMNSAIQCLVHTPKLHDYFLGDYGREINPHNPLGMNGELASAFGDLLRQLWAPDRSPVTPRIFKLKLARFAPQFSGFNQHDSQELLAFLLDGLHEDLNRVKDKPYVEAKDACGRPDEEVADEYWGNHLARNDSIIVDICQGQYKSTLVCPVCNKVSITFDPFMYLSLPLPSPIMRTMTVTVLSIDGSCRPYTHTINVPKNGKFKDFMQALNSACSLRDSESLLVTEVYANRIKRYMEEPSDSLTLISDGDRLAAYRLPKNPEQLVIFTHQRMEGHYILSKMTSGWKTFGIPLIGMLPSNVNGSTLRDLFLKLLNPFLQTKDVFLDNSHENGKDSVEIVGQADITSDSPGCEDIADATVRQKHADDELQFYLTDEKSQIMHSKIEMNEPILLTGSQKQLYVLVCWQSRALEKYDISLRSTLPEIYKSGLFSKRPQDSLTLYACLEAFLKEEPLGPEDMWYCPCCKKPQQASKKLDLWRLPEVLVIHLKRFSYSRFLKNKLETFVDFPIHDLDLSTCIPHKTEGPSYRYKLYAVSNHYGNMGGGHYTAYVYHDGQNRWYDFDDRHVCPIPEESIKTSAAYVLFYRRI